MRFAAKIFPFKSKSIVRRLWVPQSTVKMVFIGSLLLRLNLPRFRQNFYDYVAGSFDESALSMRIRCIYSEKFFKGTSTLVFTGSLGKPSTEEAIVLVRILIGQMASDFP